jgi:molybdopterin converting factor small subunit
MRVVINMFGVDVRLGEEIHLEPVSPALRDVVKALKGLPLGQLERFINDQILPVDGSVILVNGRNFLSLRGWETQIHDGDEITFMVPVAGG